MLKNKPVTHVLLLTPLFLAFVWMAFLVLQGSPEAGERLAPSRLDSLITGLFLFILSYSALLVAVFNLMKSGKKKSRFLKNS